MRLLLSDLDQGARDVADMLSPLDPWVVGGAVRNVLCGDTSPLRDLDVVVPDRHFMQAICEATRAFGPARSNRHGNPRFLLPSGLSLDLWSPGRFFEGFGDVVSMLESVDFTCNAVGLSPSAGLEARLSALDDINARLLRPISERWLGRSPAESAHLVGRAVRLVRENGFRPVESRLFRVGLETLDAALLETKYKINIATAYEVLLQDDRPE